MVPALSAEVEASIKTGLPIVRPMWMAAPEDPVALDLDDEFMVGDDILVAPVVRRGQTRRDVYLPDANATWLGGVDQKFYQGGRWLNATSAKIDEVRLKHDSSECLADKVTNPSIPGALLHSAKGRKTRDVIP